MEALREIVDSMLEFVLWLIKRWHEEIADVPLGFRLAVQAKGYRQLLLFGVLRTAITLYGEFWTLHDEIHSDVEGAFMRWFQTSPRSNDRNVNLGKFVADISYETNVSHGNNYQ